MNPLTPSPRETVKTILYKRLVLEKQMVLPQHTGLCYPACSTYLCLFVGLYWYSDQLPCGSVWNPHATEMTIKRNWGAAVLFKPEYCTLDLDSQQVPACYNKDHKKKIPLLSEYRWVYFWIQTCSLHVTSLKKQSPFLSILGIKSFLKALSDYIKHVGFWLKSLCQICRNAEAMPGALDSSQPRAVSLSASKNITFLGHL